MHRQRDKALTHYAKTLRQDMSPPERILWGILRARRLSGRKFSRQVVVGSYVVDFAARRERLAIELDGHSHDGERTQAHDEHRTRQLGMLGWRVIRFSNSDLSKSPESVAETILAELMAGRPSPQHSPQGGEGAIPSPRRGEGGSRVAAEGRGDD
jgi:very-short-patch-repair endonuclease